MEKQAPAGRLPEISWSPRVVAVAGTVVLACYALLHFAVAMWTGLDADETQMLVNAWDIFRGQRLYADFWDNHGPYQNYLLAHLYALLPQDHRALYLFRLAGWMHALVGAALVWGLARRFFPERPALPWVSAALLMWEPIYLSKASEVRPDTSLMLLWLGALWAVLAGLEDGRPRRFVLCGLLLGAAFGFSLKVTFVGFAVFLVVVWAMRLRRQILWKTLVLIGAGFAVPLAALVALLAAGGMLEGFVRIFFRENLGREHSSTFEGIRVLVRESGPWFLLALAALARSGARAWRGTALPAERLVWPAAAFLLFQFCFLLPTHNLQSALVATGPVALLAGLALVDLLSPAVAVLARRAGAAGAVALVALVALAPAARTGWVLARGFHALPDQVRYGNALLALTTPAEYVFDGTGIPLFRDRPGYYHCFPNYIIEAHKAGRLDLEIERGVTENRVRLAVLGLRETRLGEASVEFLRANFLPLEVKTSGPRINLGAGKVVEVGRNGVLRAEITIPGNYHLLRDGGRGFAVEIAETTQPLRLARGPVAVALPASLAGQKVLLSTFPSQHMGRMDAVFEFAALKPGKLRDWFRTHISPK